MSDPRAQKNSQFSNGVVFCQRVVSWTKEGSLNSFKPYLHPPQPRGFAQELKNVIFTK